MTSRDFCYWLQGFFEIREASHSSPDALDEEQLECIKKHLAMVFVHEIDPSFGGPEKQVKLDEAHSEAAAKPTSGHHHNPKTIYRC